MKRRSASKFAILGLRALVLILPEMILVENTTEIHRLMLAEYRALSMPQGKVYVWVECVKDGRNIVKNGSGSGRP